MANDLERNIKHSQAAYRFAISNLPSPHSLRSGPVRINEFEFSTEHQIESMLIELGWAFFARYEACLEMFLKQKGVALEKKLPLSRWFEKNEVHVPLEFAEGLDLYRRIRNKLHHEDGAAMDGNQTKELHLLPEHMQNFYDLFIWIEAQVSQVISRRALTTKD